MTNKQTAQEWLEQKYSDKNGTTVIEKKFNEDIELEGELKIDGYPELKKIFLSSTKKITKLNIVSCPKVEVVFVNDNQITQIEGLKDLTGLKKLNFSKNEIEEIDISANTQLEMLNFYENPSHLKFTNGIKNLAKLVLWNSDKTFAVTTLLQQISEASKEDLKELASKLKLNVENNTTDEIKQAISQEIEKINQNKAKLANSFPDLLDQGKVDDDELAEIKADVEKIKELEESNPDLVTDNEIDQTKIDGLKDANKDAMAALGVEDLKVATLEKFLGESKLTDIPTSKTLTDLLTENKNLEEIVRAAGIDPQSEEAKNEAANLRKIKDDLGKLGVDSIDELEWAAQRYFGDNFKDCLEIQAQIEVNIKK